MRSLGSVRLEEVLGSSTCTNDLQSMAIEKQEVAYSNQMNIAEYKFFLQLPENLM